MRNESNPKSEAVMIMPTIIMTASDLLILWGDYKPLTAMVLPSTEVVILLCHE